MAAGSAVAGRRSRPLGPASGPAAAASAVLGRAVPRHHPVLHRATGALPAGLALVAVGQDGRGLGVGVVPPGPLLLGRGVVGPLAHPLVDWFLTAVHGRSSTHPDPIGWDQLGRPLAWAESTGSAGDSFRW